MNSQIGVIGTAVMGRNLALNMLDHGFTVAAWNLERPALDRAVQESNGRLVAASSLEALINELETPRRILLMIQAGNPVDIVLGQLCPLLAEGDVVIDGGNSRFEDTQRRGRELSQQGLHFVGMGVSGGEDGARNGPSLMPGGSKHAYEYLLPVLQAIAAVSDSGPCVTHVGPDGAGHFLKMVHNGVEYADMQAIAEAYDLLKRIGGLNNDAMAMIFRDWNQGPLESFLIEITASILAKKDKDEYLVDQVLDQAGQKGTGRWTAQLALELGIAIPSIAAAIDARVLSSLKTQREQGAERFEPPPSLVAPLATDELVRMIRDALLATKTLAYAQAMDLINAGSSANGWHINLRETARIWMAGCIIRSRFLDTVMNAYDENETLTSLIFDDVVGAELANWVPALRTTVAMAARAGLPVPVMSASLAYFDSLRTARLPQNMTQAQRDAFGAHTYQTVRDPQGEAVHSDWLA